MVATTISRYISGDLTTQLVAASARQSSLRSVSSTHSRRSFVKADSTVSTSQRRVHFECTDELDLSDSDDLVIVGTIQATLHEFETVEPVCDLYLTTMEIQQIRSDARRQASQFAADHPDFIEDINELLENGNSVDDIGAQLETLRRRRRRRSSPFRASMQWLELDSDKDEDDVFCTDADEQEEEDESSYAPYCDDEAVDYDYFCPMRGLETRISPLFRMRRRWAVHSVLDMQQEMKQAGCCTTQIEMGLRAVCVQVSHKSRSFALRQAELDEREARTSL